MYVYICVYICVHIYTINLVHTFGFRTRTPGKLTLLNFISQSVSPYHQRQIKNASIISIPGKVHILPQASYKLPLRRLVFKVPQILKSLGEKY